MEYREIIQRSIDYIEDNLKVEISVGELAEQAGFSLFHYYRLFQSAVGVPAMQYILHRRLLHAIYAIRCGSTGIDAALAYGFDTYAGFYKAFRREFGCTPSHFLKSGRAKRPYRWKLAKEETRMVSRKKIAEILKHWNLENETVFDIYYENTGEKNDRAFYIGDAYVLKRTANLDELLNHNALSKSLKRAGLCTAVPVAAVDGREYIRDGDVYFYLTTRLPGRQMAVGELYAEDGGIKARLIGEMIGKLHLALNEIDLCVNDVNIYDTVKSWALPKAKEALGLSDAFCRTYLNDFGALYDKLPRQIIHRDPNPGNMICADGKWGFIDFELSERNVRICDPCYAATAILSESFAENAGKLEKWLELYKNIIRGYDSAARLTAEESKAIPYILLANQLICTAWFTEQEKYAELYETNRKMTRWLAEHFDALCLEA